MSHPPASGLTPAELASETGRRGFRVDGLPVFSFEGVRGLTSPWDPIWTRGRANVGYVEFAWGKGLSPGGGRRPHQRRRVPWGEEGFLPGGAEPHLRRGHLTCIAKPYLRPRDSPGARGWGGARGGRGSPRLRGGGDAQRRPRRPHLAWARGGPGPRGSLAWEWGALLMGAVPPGPDRSRLDLFTPRPAAAAAAAGGGGGRPPVPAAAVANRRAACK